MKVKKYSTLVADNFRTSVDACLGVYRAPRVALATKKKEDAPRFAELGNKKNT